MIKLYNTQWIVVSVGYPFMYRVNAYSTTSANDFIHIVYDKDKPKFFVNMYSPLNSKFVESCDAVGKYPRFVLARLVKIVLGNNFNVSPKKNVCKSISVLLHFDSNDSRDFNIDELFIDDILTSTPSLNEQLFRKG